MLKKVKNGIKAFGNFWLYSLLKKAIGYCFHKKAFGCILFSGFFKRDFFPKKNYDVFT
jgi:hypothetical protein